MNDPRADESEQEKMVDGLLRQLPHADPSLKGEPTPAAPPVTRRAQVTQGPQVGRARELDRPSAWSVWLRAVMALGLSVALPFWPYQRSCGWSLAAYGVVVVAAVGAAGWASLYSWKGHQGIAHLCGLAAMVWNLMMAAHVILPRVGYAQAGATWACTAAATPAVVPIPANNPSVVPDTSAADSLAGDSLVGADSAAVDSTVPADTSGLTTGPVSR